LGNVSERENTLLQSTIASLEQSQSNEQLLHNLDIVAKQYKESVKRLREAYDQDLKKFGREQLPEFPFADAPPPLVQGAQVGTIARDDFGNVFRWNGQQWERR